MVIYIKQYIFFSQKNILLLFVIKITLTNSFEINYSLNKNKIE